VHCWTDISYVLRFCISHIIRAYRSCQFSQHAVCGARSHGLEVPGKHHRCYGECVYRRNSPACSYSAADCVASTILPHQSYCKCDRKDPVLRSLQISSSTLQLQYVPLRRRPTASLASVAIIVVYCQTWLEQKQNTASRCTMLMFSAVCSKKTTSRGTTAFALVSSRSKPSPCRMLPCSNLRYNTPLAMH
jgi:hypothetical protein